MAHYIDLSHHIESGKVYYKGLPAPVICDYLSREDKLHYAKILRETDPRFNEIADVIDRWVEEQGQ